MRKSYLRIFPYLKIGEQVVFGAYYSWYTSSRILCEFALSDKNLKKSKTYSQLIDLFNTDPQVISVFSGSISMGVETTTIENENQIMTKAENIITKLVKDGHQGSSINRKVEGKKELEGAKILFACKSTANLHYPPTFAYDMGLTNTSKYLILVQCKNKDITLLQVDMGVAWTSDGVDLYLINGNLDKYIVVNYKAQTLNAENAEIYADRA